MNFQERKKLFDKSCEGLSKKDLQLYLFGLIETIDQMITDCPSASILLIVNTQKVLSLLEPADVETSFTISKHINSHYQEAIKAQTERN